MINKHLCDYERELHFWDRLERWHWNRVTYNRTPILWLLSWIWCIPGLHWIWQLRCSNVLWRTNMHNRRVMRKSPDLYDWSSRDG